jgi:hypothetical protein
VLFNSSPFWTNIRAALRCAAMRNGGWEAALTGEHRRDADATRDADGSSHAPLQWGDACIHEASTLSRYQQSLLSIPEIPELHALDKRSGGFP